MARPLKSGLDHFPLDISFDDDVELIEAEHGLEGFAILIKLWQKIYSNGYYIEWNDDTELLFSKKINTDKIKVNSVVNSCLLRSLFSKLLYEKYHVLTSSGIQKRYLLACASSKRKNIVFERRLLLVEDKYKQLITEFIELTPEETPVNSGESTQKRERVNESKVNESKVKREKIKLLKRTPSLSLDNQALELCKYYEQLKPGGSLSSQLPALKIFIDMYSFDWVKEALQITLSNKNEYIKSYMEKILKNWKAEGHTAITEVKPKAPSIKKNPKNSFGNYSGQRHYDIKELRKNLGLRTNNSEEGKP